MHLDGRLQSITQERISFNDALAANLDQADAVDCRIRSSIDSWIAKEGVEAIEEAPYCPSWQPGPGKNPGLDLTTRPPASVIWCTG